MPAANENIIKYLTLTGVAAFIAGLFLSHFVISLSLFILLMPVLWQLRKIGFKEILREKLFIFFLVWFALVLAGYFVTADPKSFTNDLVLKIPFLVFPFIFLNPELRKQENINIYQQVFVGMTFIVGTLSFVDYLLHKEEIDRLIFEAKPIPILYGELNHIYFSLMLAFSVFVSIFGLFRTFRKARYINIFMLLANMVYLHTIAARTGLVSFYLGIMVLLVWYGIRSRKYLLTGSAILLAILFVVFAVKKVDALQNRYQKTLEDIQTYRSGGDINHYSISMRFEYWDKAWKVFLRNPVIGTGGGDVKPDMKRIFAEEQSTLEEVNRKGPHSQYFEELAGRGILGFLILMVILLWPLKRIFREGDYLSLAFLLVILISFGVESVLQRQVGISFYVFFWLLLNRKTQAS